MQDRYNRTQIELVGAVLVYNNRKAAAETVLTETKLPILKN